MKPTTASIWTRLAAAGLLISLLPSCFKDRLSQTQTYTITKPVYALKATVLAHINGDANRPIDTVGKVYEKGNYIYLNELNQGIHIIDNSDPTHPQQIAFINIPGNEDMAIHGNTLYADMGTDLLALDITDPRQVKLSGTIPALFTPMGYPYGYVDTSMVITGWIVKDTTVPYNQPPYVCMNCMVLGSNVSVPATYSQSSVSVSVNGTGGSSSKMTLIDDHLFVISESHTLGVVDVTNAARPALVKSFFAGLDLETIYPFQDKLFLGSLEGVYIYDVSDPANPTQEAQFTHGTACDPVIADGDYAYVTLHAGTSCGGSTNELDVIDVQNLLQPVLVSSYPMTAPTGLAKDGNMLFVCDGNAGVKVFDATEPYNLKLVTAIGQNTGYDVIAGSGRLLEVASQGLYQYDYTNPAAISRLSALPVMDVQ